MAKKSKKELTIESSMIDFRAAYRAKKKLLDRQNEDFLFALGEQWDPEDKEKLKKAGIKAITDNRIAPNIFLLTGLERQNRSDFKAFPEGDEDGVAADIASALLKDAIKKSGFSYKSSDQFKNGITCGEAHLEPYLDFTESLINGKLFWRQADSTTIFPEPGSSEYDFSDAKYVYKLTTGIASEDLINLYPDMKKAIEEGTDGRLNLEIMAGEAHIQPKDYPKKSDGKSSGDDNGETSCGFDLIERYYKKWVETAFIGDKQTGTIQKSETKDKAKAFIDDYKNQIVSDQQAYEQAINQHSQGVQQALADHIQQRAMIDPTSAHLPVEQHLADMNGMGKLQAPPPPPPQRDPERFLLIKRMVPEIWCFAHAAGISEPLGDERAWFYPKWKTYHFVPFFARLSTAPLKGDQAHLLVQGLVHGVKGVQEKHNKAEMLMLRHLNQSANSGWLVETDTWEDPTKVEQAGSSPGINLEYKQGKQKPERIFPQAISTGHAEIAAESAEAIKAQLGINADLLASQEGGADSGRAIALRQRQGLLMVQEPFDNHSRSRTIAGSFTLSQLGEMYDTETAKKVLGEAFLAKNFPPPMVLTGQVDPATGQPAQAPMPDSKTGQPMQYDDQMAELSIAEVLAGDLEKYNVTVGEGVSSETQKMANSQEVKDISQNYPGLIPPDILIEESQLPQATKNKILSSIQKAQALQQQLNATGGGKPTPVKANAKKEPA